MSYNTNNLNYIKRNKQFDGNKSVMAFRSEKKLMQYSIIEKSLPQYIHFYLSSKNDFNITHPHTKDAIGDKNNSFLLKTYLDIITHNVMLITSKDLLVNADKYSTQKFLSKCDSNKLEIKDLTTKLFTLKEDYNAFVKHIADLLTDNLSYIMNEEGKLINCKNADPALIKKAQKAAVILQHILKEIENDKEYLRSFYNDVQTLIDVRVLTKKEL